MLMQHVLTQVFSKKIILCQLISTSDSESFFQSDLVCKSTDFDFFLGLGTGA